MKKKQPPKKAPRPVRSKPAPSRPEPPPQIPVASTTPAAKPTAAPTPKRVVGRLHHSTLTPAGMRGRDLVRFLRIHAKKPYGKRGEEAIRQLAVEVGHLGNLELNARTGTEDGR